MKLRGTSDMTTEPGRIHNYRIDYKIRITVLDYPQGGSTTGAGLYDMGSTCTVTASVNGGYEFAGWYEDGRIVSNDTRYSFEVLSDRTLEPRYRNYGGWSVTLTANPSVIGWQGGRSSLVAEPHAECSSTEWQKTHRRLSPPSAEEQKDSSFQGIR